MCLVLFLIPYVFSRIFDSVLCQYEYGSRNPYNLFLFPYYFTVNARLVISITYYYEISSSLDVFSRVFLILYYVSMKDGSRNTNSTLLCF